MSVLDGSKFLSQQVVGVHTQQCPFKSIVYNDSRVVPKINNRQGSLHRIHDTQQWAARLHLQHTHTVQHDGWVRVDATVIQKNPHLKHTHASSVNIIRIP